MKQITYEFTIYDIDYGTFLAWLKLNFRTKWFIKDFRNILFSSRDITKSYTEEEFLVVTWLANKVGIEVDVVNLKLRSV